MGSRRSPPAVHRAAVACAGMLAVLLLAGCAAPREKKAEPAEAADAAAARKPATPPRAAMDRKLSEAVVAPLADLNLVRTPIPPILVAAQKAPYAVPADASCTGLAAEISALDTELDPDLDSVANDAAPSLFDRGSTAATDAVIGAVRNTTEGVLPFRGWVRKLTGAERYAKEVAGAIAAGTVRRAFLKGLGKSAGCAPPAAPLPPPELKAKPEPAPKPASQPQHGPQAPPEPAHAA